MLELDVLRWKSLKGGYRLPYDPTPRLKELESGAKDLDAIWQEFWNELHHQGDVDIASYATVPHLARITIRRNLLDWNVFALVATVEECRSAKDNPPMPSWLKDDYEKALGDLAEFGARNITANWSDELACSILAVIAFAKGLPKHGRLLICYTDDELDEALGEM